MYKKCRKSRKCSNNVLKCSYVCTKTTTVQLEMLNIVPKPHTKSRLVRTTMMWRRFWFWCFSTGWRDGKFCLWWCSVAIVTEKHRTWGNTVQIINRHFRITSQDTSFISNLFCCVLLERKSVCIYMYIVH